ncbi:MAG: MazG-like family protein [Schleiferilactobacillus perolens]|nr:hypothetical protein [Schleiferilactobacillus harbinensis]
MEIDTRALQKRILENKRNHHFNTTDVKFELLCMYGEVNELFQACLKNDSDNIGEELADINIYLLGLAEILGKDLVKETLAKLAIDEKRVYRKGIKIDPGEE